MKEPNSSKGSMLICGKNKLTNLRSRLNCEHSAELFKGLGETIEGKEALKACFTTWRGGVGGNVDRS